LFGDLELLRSSMIAKGVMAIAEMSPRPHHAVGAFFKCTEYVCRADPSGTHHPYQSHIGRILYPTHPGRIRTRIRTPVTGEDDDSGVKIIFLLFHSLLSLQFGYSHKTNAKDCIAKPFTFRERVNEITYAKLTTSTVRSTARLLRCSLIRSISCRVSAVK
jgi:hypothetical protein